MGTGGYVPDSGRSSTSSPSESGSLGRFPAVGAEDIIVWGERGRGCGGGQERVGEGGGGLVFNGGEEPKGRDVLCVDGSGFISFSYNNSHSHLTSHLLRNAFLHKTSHTLFLLARPSTAQTANLFFPAFFPLYPPFFNFNFRKKTVSLPLSTLDSGCVSVSRFQNSCRRTYSYLVVCQSANPRPYFSLTFSFSAPRPLGLGITAPPPSSLCLKIIIILPAPKRTPYRNLRPNPHVRLVRLALAVSSARCSRPRLFAAARGHLCVAEIQGFLPQWPPCSKSYRQSLAARRSTWRRKGVSRTRVDCRLPTPICTSKP
jgi:hypothetical protein